MISFAPIRGFAARRPAASAAAPALLSGLLLTACQPPWGQAWLAPLALVPLLVAALITPRPFLTGWLAGAVHFTTLLGWVYTVMTRHGPLAGWLAALLTGLLGTVLGLYVALFTSAVAFCARRRGPGFALAAAPFLWVGTEILRAKWLTGFPWCPLGNALWEHQRFAWPASLGAVWLLSLLCATGASALTGLIRRTDTPPRLESGVIGGFAILAAWCAVALVAERRDEPPGPAMLRIVQPAIPQDQKWDPAFARESLRRLERLNPPRTAAIDEAGLPTPELVLLPESSLPDVDAAELNFTLDEITFAQGSRILLGVEYVRDDKVYNAAVLLGHGPYRSPIHLPVSGDVGGLRSPVPTRFDLPEEGFYAKRHLAPFGEYVPWRRWLFFARKLTHGIGDFTPGEGAQPIDADGHRLAVLICYEAIFPELAAEAAREPGVGWLVNLSNDAWFDGTGAKRQLLAMSVMRVRETGLPLIRVANTGYSGVITRNHVTLMPADEPLARDFTPPYGAGASTAARFGDQLPWLYLALAASPLLISLLRPARDPVLSTQDSALST